MLETIVATILIYSAITTMILCISGFKDEIAQLLSVGVWAIMIVPVYFAYEKISTWIKYGSKRSIILDKEKNEYFWCKLKDTNDLCGYHNRYNLETRYAFKNSWSKYQEIDKEEVRKSKENCDHCSADCLSRWDEYKKCKTDSYEFFEPKTKVKK